MPGQVRVSNQQASTSKGRFRQKYFNGVNLDYAASEIGDDELAAGTENLICFGKEARGRSGSAEAFSTALPGSGTVWQCVFHKLTKKFFLHRGALLYKANQTLSSWVELTDVDSTSFGDNEQSRVRADGPDLILSTPSGIYKIELSSADATVIKKVNSAAPDTPIGGQTTGTTHTYRMLFTYGRLTGTVTNGRITPGAVLEIEGGSPNVTDPDLTDYGTISVTDLIDKDNPFTFHFVQEFTADAASDVITCSQAYDTGSRIRVSNAGGALPGGLTAGVDYYAINIGSTTMKVATSYVNAIAGTAVNITDAGTGTHRLYADIVNNMDITHTHICLYMTGPLGADDVNPETNTGYNREEYVWVADFSMTGYAVNKSLTIDVDYLTWLARASDGSFFLKTRKWAPMPSGEICANSGSWFFVADRNVEFLYYCQISDEGGKGVHLGYYVAAWQFMRFPDGIQAMEVSTDLLTVWTNNDTYTVRLTAFDAAGRNADIQVLSPYAEVESEIGITDWGSLTRISENRYIGKFSDNSIRFWNGIEYSDDLSFGKVNTEVVQMINGSVGAYAQGAWYLYYRKASGDTNNTNCLRLAVERKAGVGWAPVTGASFPFPATFVGAVVHINANSIQRLLILHAADGKFKWIETFTAYSGSSLTRVAQDSAVDVTCKVQFKEVIGQKIEANKIIEACAIGVRPYTEAGGYISGFEMVAKMFTDGATTAEETITDSPYKGDIEYFKEHEGRRLQGYCEFNSTQMRITEYVLKYLEQDKKNIGEDITDTDEYTRQRNLAQSFLHDFAKPRLQIDKYDASLATLTGTLTATTGPDGKSASAFQCAASGTTSIVKTATKTYDESNPYTIIFWVKNPPTSVDFLTIAGTNALTIQFSDATTISISGETKTVADVTDGEWHCFCIYSCGCGYPNIRQNKTAKGTVRVTTKGGGNLTLGGAMASAVFYHFRIYNDEKLPADLDYYYDDIVSHEGKSVMPYG